MFYTEIRQGSPKPWNKIEMIEILCSVILTDMIKLTMRNINKAKIYFQERK